MNGSYWNSAGKFERQLQRQKRISEAAKRQIERVYLEEALAKIKRQEKQSTYIACLLGIAIAGGIIAALVMLVT